MKHNWKQGLKLVVAAALWVTAWSVVTVGEPFLVTCAAAVSSAGALKLWGLFEANP